MNDLDKLRRENEELRERVRHLESQVSAPADENSLSPSESLHAHLALQASQDGIWDWYAETDESYFSNRYYTMLGYEPGEFPASYKAWVDLVHPDDRESAVEIIDATARGAIPTFEVEMRLRSKEGGYRWILARGQIVEKDENGKCRRMAGTHTDITARKMADLRILSHLHYLENIRRVDNALHLDTDLEAVLQETMRTVRQIFNCDRAWLIRNAAPDESHWWLHCVDYSEEHPPSIGIRERNELDEHLGAIFRELRESGKAITFDPRSERPIPKEAAENNIASMLVMILNPRLGSPWLVGLDHCAEKRIWTEEEITLLEGISARIEDALSNLLLFDQLRESEENLSITLNSIGDGVIVLDTDGRITRLNPIAESLTGWRSEEAVGKPIDLVFFVVHEYTGKAIDAPIKRVIEECTAIEIDKHAILINRDGTQYAIADSCAPILDKNRELTGAVMVFRDQTEERQAQKVLRRSHEELETLVAERTAELQHSNSQLEEKIQERHEAEVALNAALDQMREAERELRDNLKMVETFLDTIPNPVFYKDTEGRYQGCNRVFAEKILGIPKEKVIGQTLFDLPEQIPTELAAVYHKHDMELIRGRKPQNYEAQVRCSDGTHRDFLLSKAVYTEESGQVAGMVGVMVDISERKEMERQVRDSEERYRSLMENINVGVALLSPEMRVLTMNRQMRKWFPEINLADEPVCHQAFNTPARATPCDYCPACPALIDGKVHESVTSTPTPRGVRHYRIVATPLKDEDGTITAIIEMVDDITERMQTEEALIRSERMAAVGTLASGVAHEFNNINVSVLGFSQLALKKTELDEETRMYFDRIAKAAIRAKAITTNLLAFCGESPGRIAPANLVGCVRESLGMVERDLTTSGIEIELHLEPIDDIMMDSAQIGQVVLNLLINAQHSLIDRPVKKIRIETGELGDLVFVKISDTGCGIPPDKISRIFSPFFSTKGEHAEEESPQSRVRGTGLGLSVSDTIVKKHKGEIRAKSQENVGSTFTILLPRDTTVETPPPPPERSETSDPISNLPVDQASILVVDDEEDTREFMKVMLSQLGHHAVAASRAEQALALLREERFDLLVSDIQMPDLDGIEFLQAVQAMHLNPPPLIMVMTGKETAGVQEDLGDMVVFDILQKPFELYEIRDKIEHALSHQRRMHAP